MVTHDPEIGRRTARQVAMEDGRIISDSGGAG
jgi:predicted ABC-type transport system involved in lysophospholipase L1 biosynthesis ATPase subunit